MLTNLLEGLEEQDPGCTYGQPRELLLCKPGEAGNSCHDCWFQNQTLFAAVGDLEAATELLAPELLPACRSQTSKTDPWQPLRFPPNSALDSGLVWVHQMADMESLPQPWLQVHLGTVILKSPISAAEESAQGRCRGER